VSEHLVLESEISCFRVKKDLQSIFVTESPSFVDYLSNLNNFSKERQNLDLVLLIKNIIKAVLECMICFEKNLYLYLKSHSIKTHDKSYFSSAFVLENIRKLFKEKLDFIQISAMLYNMAPFILFSFLVQFHPTKVDSSMSNN
jgi:hypothetical protein